MHNSERPNELIGRTVTINRPRSELYAFWRDFSNLPQFMENIESVTVIDARRSHWVVSAPGGTSVEWDSVVTEDIRDHLIAWQSAEEADVTHSGVIAMRKVGAAPRSPRPSRTIRRAAAWERSLPSCF